MEKTVNATILFADLMNSTEMAKNLTLQEYDAMIIDFQNTMYEVASSHLKDFGYRGEGEDSEWSIAGDELRVFLYSGSSSYDIRNALLIAIKIKIGWLISAYNQKILKEGRLVSRIGVGINCGKVMKDVTPWRSSSGVERAGIEGYAINLTKRIESTSRDGTAYQIMVGDSLYRDCNENHLLNVSFSRSQSPFLKGLGHKIPIYEVVSLINYEILPTLPKAMQEGLEEKLEYAVSQPMPEPWIFPTLLRNYISGVLKKPGQGYEAKTIKLANQALGVVEYKKVIFNILGWLHTYVKSVRNLRMAIHYFNQALRIEPNDLATLLHVARISDMTGKRDLARRAYERIIVFKRDHTEARRKLAQL